MRLINLRTLQLHEYFGDAVPPYAILSHTWDQDEVTFADMCNPTKLVQRKAGYVKIARFAQVVLERQSEFWVWNEQSKLEYKTSLEFGWVDTCCIDKSSSAELSEAINSMFRWYRGSRICIVYLQDVQNVQGAQDGKLEHARWFTRGWTLQELIAPRNVIFYSSRWQIIGKKTDPVLVQQISRITGIAEDVLLTNRTNKASIAQKMCWASRRRTTRKEDMAYSLLGIFNVNMPLLYGEGDKAFVRLQEEIIKSSYDDSIFAWTDEGNDVGLYSELFSSSPTKFKNCQDIVYQQPDRAMEPYAKTNLGLQISLPVRLVDSKNLRYFAELECRYSSHHLREKRIGIYIQRVSPNRNEFARTRTSRNTCDLEHTSTPLKNLRIYVRRDSILSAVAVGTEIYGYSLYPERCDSGVDELADWSIMNESTKVSSGLLTTQILSLSADAGYVCRVFTRTRSASPNGSERFWIHLRYDAPNNLVLCAVSQVPPLYGHEARSLIEEWEWREKVSLKLQNGSNVSLSVRGREFLFDRLQYAVDISIWYK